MKALPYLRIARGSRGLLYSATAKPSHAPLTDAHGGPLPTVCIKLELDLPTDFFDPAVAVLQARVPKDAPELAMEIKA